MNDSKSDAVLLRGIARKDARCLELLMNRYTGYIIAVIRHIADKRLTYQDMEEICSDVFVKIWSCSTEIIPRAETLKPYIGAMARNMTFNRLKKLTGQACCDIEEINTGTTSKEIENMGLRDSLNRAVGSLKQPDRDLFIERFVFWEPVKKLAEKFGMNANTAATKISRARKSVAKFLKEGEEIT